MSIRTYYSGQQPYPVSRQIPYPGVLSQWPSEISPEGQAQQPLSGEFGIHVQGKPRDPPQKQVPCILLGHRSPGGICSQTTVL